MIKKYKTLLVGIFLLLSSILLFVSIAIYKTLTSSSPSFALFWGFIDFESILYNLAGTCFSTAIIAFAYEWYMRKESTKELTEIVDKAFRKQNLDITKYGKEERNKLLSQILKNKLNNSATLSRYIEGMISECEKKEMWSDYQCEIRMTKIETLPQKVLYGLNITFSYTTTIAKSGYHCIVVGTVNDMQKAMDSGAFEVVWLAPMPENYQFSQQLNPQECQDSLRNAFSIKHFRINKEDVCVVDKGYNSTYCGIAYEVTLPHSERQESTELYYSFDCKIEGNSMNISLPMLTHNVKISFNYASLTAEIADVDTFSYFPNSPDIKILNRDDT